jgi:hypothetical protein
MFVVDRDTLNRREVSLLDRLEREFDSTLLRSVLLPVVTQTSPISLRALDWAVVNWSKKHNIICSSMAAGEMTNVHHAYRTNLAFWKRRLFDPFRRRGRIGVLIDGTCYETTLGQANFVLFAHRTGILAYAIGHMKAIEEDMNQVAKRHKRERHEALQHGVRRKRTELTKASNAPCVVYTSPSSVSFD